MRNPALKNYEFYCRSENNLSVLSTVSRKINQIWQEEIVDPKISLKSNLQLEAFFKRIKNEINTDTVKVDRLDGATTALILKVHDLMKWAKNNY
jgi:hypothetical protein